MATAIDSETADVVAEELAIADAPAAPGADVLDVRRAQLSDYFGLWSIMEAPFETLVRAGLQGAPAAADTVTPPALRAAAGLGQGDDEEDDSYQLVGDTAVIMLAGPLMKATSWWGGTSTVAARIQLARAVADPAVRSILILIESPGGTVSGTKDLADDVAAAAAEKPCYAYIQDLGASAAYWVASQATKVFANETAMVGSIGTFMAVVDSSKVWNEYGFKVHVISSGGLKGAGTPGTEITAEQLAHWQQTINEMQQVFTRSVATGRQVSLKLASSLADGRAHVAGTALELKLIDGIQSVRATLAALSKARVPRKGAKAEESAGDPASHSHSTAGGQAVGISQEDLHMSTAAEKQGASAGAQSQNNAGQQSAAQQQAATLPQLEAACAGADEKFVLGQLRIGASLESARTAWTAALHSQLTVANKTITDLRAELATFKDAGANAGLGNAAALGDGTKGAQGATGAGGANVKDQWNALVGKFMAQGMKKDKAILAASAENEALHDAYIEACNADRKQPRNQK